MEQRHNVGQIRLICEFVGAPQRRREGEKVRKCVVQFNDVTQSAPLM